MIPTQTIQYTPPSTTEPTYEAQFAALPGIWIDRFGERYRISQMPEAHLFFAHRMLVEHFVRKLGLEALRSERLVIVTLSECRKLRELHDDLWRRGVRQGSGAGGDP